MPAALPELTVLRDRYVPSPESEGAELGLPADAVASVPFDFAASYDWPTDAHCTQYECVTLGGVDVRLAGGALEEGVPVKMVWLIGDVDAPAHCATDEWRADTEPRLEASGLAWHATTGGYRVIARLAKPVVLETPADGDRWKRAYHAWCEDMWEAHGLELDTQACDWTRLFRLPRVVRGNRPTANDVHGCPPAVTPPTPRPAAATPTTPAERSAKPTGGDAFDRAIALAARVPPSVEGHGGDRALFDAASELATILDDASEIHAVLEAVFNPRCLPPWPSSKLAREANTAVERVAALGGVAAWAKRRHAKAEERTDSYEGASGFDELPLVTDLKGRPLPTIDNILVALSAWFEGDLWLNEMNGRVHCDRARDMLDCPDGVWRDVNTTALQAALQRVGIRVGRPDTDNAVSLYAARNGRNRLADTLAELSEKWDGTPRVDGALARYWGCDDTPATRASARITLLSMAARGMAPGTKVDTCLVLVGDQGTGKSTSLKTLALQDEWFGDSDLPLGDKDARQLLRGKWVWEVQEMASMHKREAEQVKAFISQTYDTFRASYGRHVEDVPRTCMLFGTANRADILQDPTGNRRFLPVVTGALDVEALKVDRDQLLGEAAARVLAGEQHWPTVAEAAVLRKAAKAFEEVDPWSEAVSKWLTSRPSLVGEGFTTAEVFSFGSGAIPIEDARQSPRDSRRLTGILQSLGFTRSRTRRKGVRGYFWLKTGVKASTTPEAPTPDRLAVN